MNFEPPLALFLVPTLALAALFLVMSAFQGPSLYQIEAENPSNEAIKHQICRAVRDKFLTEEFRFYCGYPSEGGR